MGNDISTTQLKIPKYMLSTNYLTNSSKNETLSYKNFLTSVINNDNINNTFKIKPSQIKQKLNSLYSVKISEIVISKLLTKLNKLCDQNLTSSVFYNNFTNFTDFTMEVLIEMKYFLLIFSDYLESKYALLKIFFNKFFILKQFSAQNAFDHCENLEFNFNIDNFGDVDSVEFDSVNHKHSKALYSNYVKNISNKKNNISRKDLTVNYLSVATTGLSKAKTSISNNFSNKVSNKSNVVKDKHISNVTNVPLTTKGQKSTIFGMNDSNNLQKVYNVSQKQLIKEQEVIQLNNKKLVLTPKKEKSYFENIMLSQTQNKKATHFKHVSRLELNPTTSKQAISRNKLEPFNTNITNNNKFNNSKITNPFQCNVQTPRKPGDLLNKNPQKKEIQCFTQRPSLLTNSSKSKPKTKETVSNTTNIKKNNIKNININIKLNIIQKGDKDSKNSKENHTNASRSKPKDHVIENKKFVQEKAIFKSNKELVAKLQNENARSRNEVKSLTKLRSMNHSSDNSKKISEHSDSDQNPETINNNRNNTPAFHLHRPSNSLKEFINDEEKMEFNKEDNSEGNNPSNSFIIYNIKPKVRQVSMIEEDDESDVEGINIKSFFKGNIK